MVIIKGREVGIIRYRDRWFAIRNVCPHVGAPLCIGAVQPHLSAESASSPQPVVEDERITVRCPWHRWEFDLATGYSLTGKERTKTYPVHVEGDRVFIETERALARH